MDNIRITQLLEVVNEDAMWSIVRRHEDDKTPIPEDPEKFWKEINRHKAQSCRELARLPFEKKIEILAQMQRDWQDLMDLKSESNQAP